MSGRPIARDATDQSTVIRIVDAVDGTPETGVTSATSGLDLKYRREGATAVSLTESDLSALNDAHSDGGMLHIGDGYYRVDLPDAAVAAGAAGVLVFGAVTGMVVIGTYHPLVADLETEINDVQADIAALNDPSAAAIAAEIQGIIRRNTAQAGSNNTITLDTGASAVTDFYVGNKVVIVSGTGAGQTRLILAYNATSKVADVYPNWATNPDATSVFAILPHAAVDLRLWRANTPDLLTGGLLQAQANQLGTQAKADVNAEALDVLNVDTLTLPGQAAPSATPTLREAIGWLYKTFRNKKEQTATEWRLYDDAGTTVDSKAAVSDDGTTATKEEVASGP